MFFNVLLLGIAGGIDPAKIAAVTYILTKTKRPERLLAAYLLGGFGVSLIVGAVIMFVLGDIGLSSRSGAPAPLLIAIGILSLIVALLVGTGLTARIRNWGEERRGAAIGGQNAMEPSAGAESRADQPGSEDKVKKMEQSIRKVPGLRKLLPPIRRALASESPWIAWIAGVGIGMPSAYYLAAIAIVLKSGVSTAQQILSLLLFNVFNFGAVLIPLIAYLRAPQATANFVTGANNWVATHHRAFVAVVTGVVGIYLIILGVTRL